MLNESLETTVGTDLCVTAFPECSEFLLERTRPWLHCLQWNSLCVDSHSISMPGAKGPLTGSAHQTLQ